MTGGNYLTFRGGPGIRATVNAWLEEISFRTGMTAAAIFLLALAAITVTAVMAGASSSSGAVVHGAGSHPATATAAPVSAPPTSTSTPGRPSREASTPPARKAVQPPTAAVPASPQTGQQPTAGSGSDWQENWPPASSFPVSQPYGRWGWGGSRHGGPPAGFGRHGGFRG